MEDLRGFVESVTVEPRGGDITEVSLIVVSGGLRETVRRSVTPGQVLYVEAKALEISEGGD